ncbi:Domain of unkown function [Micromonospora echinaurantiaca]|uniref:Domain of unkown function n=1 Tax=Micromonospora echinaurantiaca TaxID=47857 RepID=A0A1C5ISS9_9ACTN|nr:YcnI family protein [Micromonospora echinaurantiaca]SCG61428.1 Domain of unkown function [Micromonospora echinaurantiaca]
MAMTRGLGRRAGAVAALAAAGVLVWPATADAADVTTNPTQARQGDAVKLEFVVPEERPGTRTDRIEVRLPADAPIAEVYPMSVDGWAPRIVTRRLDQPVTDLHGIRLDTVTSAVTWTRMPGYGAAPARLTLSMGPLPQVDRLTFQVIQTYADGTVVRWADPAGAHRAPVLALSPAAPGAVAGHAGHGARPAGGTDAGGAAPGLAAGGGAPAPGAGADDGGNADALLAAGLLAGLGGGAAIGWLASRWRRREPAAPIDRSVLDEEPSAPAGTRAVAPLGADPTPEVPATDSPTPAGGSPAPAGDDGPAPRPAELPQDETAAGSRPPVGAVRGSAPI